MKKYFAKYIPVKEKIKKGDKFRWIINSIIQGEIHTCTDDGERPEKYQKLKLFLCSNDINIFDQVTSILNGNKMNANLIPHTHPHYVKLIGEISNEALWVKEGDEFDEDELGWIESGSYFEPEIIPFDKKPKYHMGIAIKGPCGHFH